MLSVTADFYRVLRYCHRWGVEVRIADYAPPYDTAALVDWHDAPTVMAHVEWPVRRIWWDPSSCAHWDAAVALLHELSHCVDPMDPEKTDEITGPFLAFEYYSTRLLKLAGRVEWMRHYGLGEADARNEEWGDISSGQRGRLIRDSLALAVAAGTLTPEGRPTYRLPRIM